MKIANLVVAGALSALTLGATAGAVGSSVPKGFTDDFDAARAEAAKTGKKIVAVFSGSDWCYWCKKLEREYLSKPAFVESAKKDFVLVFIDTPRDRSVLSETAKKNNRALTERYGIQGFPTVKILAADGKPVADCRPSGDATPGQYADQLRAACKSPAR